MATGFSDFHRKSQSPSATTNASTCQGLLTPELANKLLAGAEPFLAPDGPDVPEELRRSFPQRMHDALGQLLDAALGGAGLPQSRGLDTLAMLIVDLDWITQGHDIDDLTMREHAGAVTFQGEPLPAETARRILCDARICRVITKGRSQVLDIGRATKVWPDPIRRAVYARDGGRCRRCGRPRPHLRDSDASS
ncbi:MAG: 13E12 repeat family protein [Actinobacteria bacterium]|nr:13E12 repeat family protein [Actinomycetota bacterium]